MANRQIIGLSAVVLGIMLAAGLGIRSANSWLSSSTSTNADQDNLVSIEPNGLNDNDSGLNLIEGDRARQSNRAGEQLVGQANSIDANQPLSPIEEAGTYIQRQKRVEQDAVIANTPVEIIPNSSGTPVASQSNTVVNPQPTAPAPVTTTTPSTPAVTPAIADPIPALW